MSDTRYLLLAAALLLFPVSASAQDSRDLILIPGAKSTDVRSIEAQGAVVNDVSDDGIEAEASRAEQKALAGLGYRVEVITQNITDVYRRNALLPAQDAWYMPYATFADTMRVIAQNNPSFIKLETLGYSVGNRVVMALRFSDNPQVHENEPAIHFDGDIHGDEKIGWAVLFEMVKYLAQNYGSDTLVTRLVNTREIWLVPMLNPDGYEGARRSNGNNVDLNRNWGWMWGGESSCGSGPFSEPETRALLQHVWRHPFSIFVSYHAGTRYISYPWSYQRYDSIPEKWLIHFLSQRYTVPNGYPYGQGAIGMYEINGSSKDVNYGSCGTMGWSIEVHNSKTPAASEIVPTFNINRTAILEFFHRAGQGIHGTVTDATTGAPIRAQILVGPKNWPSYSDAALGDFHRFYLPGTYDATISAPGYLPATVNDVVVPNTGDSAVVLDVRLTRDTSARLFGFRHVYNSYITNPSSNHTYPVKALGVHDNVSYQLDNGKYICIDMDVPVRDVTGADLTVYQAGGSGTASVQGSNAWNGTWTNIGSASGSQTDFDLSSTPLDSVRFVKLTASSAFYLDAIEGVNWTGISEPGQARMPVRTSLEVLANPARGSLRLSLSRKPETALRILIRDAAGRLVSELQTTDQEFVWDRLDQVGREAPAGVYFCQLALSGSRPVRAVLTR